MLTQEIIIIYKYNYLKDKTKPKITKFHLQYNNDTKILDIKNYLEQKNIAITAYNQIEGLIFYYNTFDYIISENEVIWNPKIEDVKIVDYIRTFNSNIIEVENIPDEIGEPTVIFSLNIVFKIIKDILKFLWNQREFISYIFTFYQILSEIKKYIKNIKKNTGYQIEASSYFFSILIQSDWNLEEFKKKYRFKKNEAIAILELLGYKYIKSKNIYHITSKKRKNTVDNIKIISQSKSNEFIDKIFNH